MLFFRRIIGRIKTIMLIGITFLLAFLPYALIKLIYWCNKTIKFNFIDWAVEVLGMLLLIGLFVGIVILIGIIIICFLFYLIKGVFLYLYKEDKEGLLAVVYLISLPVLGIKFIYNDCIDFCLNYGSKPILDSCVGWKNKTFFKHLRFVFLFSAICLFMISIFNTVIYITLFQSNKVDVCLRFEYFVYFLLGIILLVLSYIFCICLFIKMLKYKEVNNSNIMSKNSIVCSHCNMINPIIKKVLINKELIDSKKSDDYDYSNVASLHDSDGNTYSVYAKRYLGTTTSSQYKCSYKIRCLDCKRDIKYIIYKWE